MTTLVQVSESHSVCWSRKGKQLVVGYANGQLKQISPGGDVKRVIEKPSFVTSNKILNVFWVEDTVFLALYCDEQDTEVVVINRSENKAYNILDPAASFGSPNPNRYYLAYLNSSHVFKHCIIIGNEASTDVGVVGCDANGVWSPWTLEEGSGIVMPIEDDEDTYPVGMDLLFCNKVKLPGVTPDDPPYPAFPILLVTNNKGSVMGYHCMHKKTEEGDLYLANMVSSIPYGSPVTLKENKSISMSNSGTLGSIATGNGASKLTNETKPFVGSAVSAPSPFSFTKVEKKEPIGSFGPNSLVVGKASVEVSESKITPGLNPFSTPKDATSKTDKNSNPFLGSGATPSLFSSVKTSDTKVPSSNPLHKASEVSRTSESKKAVLNDNAPVSSPKNPSESLKQQLLVNEFDKHYSALQSDLNTVGCR
jgi:hypothetical protein